MHHDGSAYAQLASMVQLSAFLAILTQVQHGTMDVSPTPGSWARWLFIMLGSSQPRSWEERRTLGIRQALLHHVRSMDVLQARDVVILLLIRVIVPRGG